MQQTISACPKPVTEPGTTVPRDHGLYRLDLSLPVDGGFTINTYHLAAVDRIDALCFTTADADTANLIYQVISEGGDNGVNPAGIRAALDHALRNELFRVQARQDLPSRNRVEHINAVLDRLESPADTAAVAELTEHVRRNLADTVPAGRHSTVASPSRTGVEHKPLTKPQQRIVAGHINGVVYAGNGVRWTSLRSIARKGHAAEVHYEPGTHRIASIVLNERGHAAAVKAGA